jgi:mannobiose 2-epimerase
VAILRGLTAAARRELTENILPFWLKLEDPSGGHWISVDAIGRIDKTAPRKLVFAARMAWTLSEAARRLRSASLREAAERAHRYLQEFGDGVKGGYFASLTPEGAPLDRSKHVYGQAFAIYALAAFGQMAGERSAIRAALDLFGIVETRTRRPETGLYVESFDADWRETPNVERALGEQIAPHTADTHLHLIEAYIQLLAVSKNRAVAFALTALVETFAARFVHDSGTFAFQKLDRRGHSVKSAIWPGHDIEASWLFGDALDLLGDIPSGPAIRRLARSLALGAMTNGMRAGGGWTERVHDGAADPWCLWWVQAEAVLGMLNDGLRTGDTQMIARAAQTWHFIEQRQRDAQAGDWHLRVSATGEPDLNCPLVVSWKDPYHQARACMEILERCTAALGSTEPETKV